METQAVLTLIISGLVGAIIAFIVAYLVTKNVEGAALAALDQLLQDGEWLETVEFEIDEAVPEDVQQVIMALLLMSERLANGTPTQADDKLVQLLREIIGGDA